MILVGFIWHRIGISSLLFRYGNEPSESIKSVDFCFSKGPCTWACYKFWVTNMFYLRSAYIKAVQHNSVFCSYFWFLPRIGSSGLNNSSDKPLGNLYRDQPDGWRGCVLCFVTVKYCIWREGGRAIRMKAIEIHFGCTKLTCYWTSTSVLQIPL